MHVKTWKKNITEGGEVTLEVREDPFAIFPVRVPLTDLMNMIKSHDDARRHKITAVNRRWSFTKSPSGWLVFIGVSSFIIILAIGYLIYRCCKTVPQPVSLAMGEILPRGAAQEIGKKLDNNVQQCEWKP